jgi:voltage-gated potassium channel
VGRQPVVMVLGTGRWKWIYEGAMIALAVLVVVLLPMSNEGWVLVTNLVIWGLFVVDYVTRLVLSTDKRAFLRANIVDLLAIMPADFFRALRVLRLARLLRVVRAATVVGRVLRDVRGVVHTNGLNWVLIVSLCAVISGALVVWLVEPGIEQFGDAMWWAVVTATTVGYGDLAPVNPLARVVAVALMLVGIGTLGMLTGAIATYFIGDDPSSNPEIEHIRSRLGDWEELTAEERHRLAAVLMTVATTPTEAGQGIGDRPSPP